MHQLLRVFRRGKLVVVCMRCIKAAAIKVVMVYGSGGEVLEVVGERWVLVMMVENTHAQPKSAQNRCFRTVWSDGV